MTLISSDRYTIVAQEDRSAPRTRLTIPVRLRVSGAGAFETVVQDLSIGGFSAATISRMYEGQICWLTLPGLESRQAQVVWWNACTVGCAFDQMLSPIVHETILARYAREE